MYLKVLSSNARVLQIKLTSHLCELLHHVIGLNFDYNLIFELFRTANNMNKKVMNE